MAIVDSTVSLGPTFLCGQTAMDTFIATTVRI
jgi:hypothetical protein